MIAYYWKESANNSGKSLSVFSNPENFIKIADYYSKDATIYIDSSLDNEVKGEDVAKTLYERGFHHLILATGYPKSRFAHLAWIKDVVGKEPPWE